MQTERILIIFVIILNEANSKLKLNHNNNEHIVKTHRLVSCISDIVHSYNERRTLIFVENEALNSVTEYLIKSALNATSIITSKLSNTSRNYGFYILQPSATIILPNYKKILQHAHKSSFFLIIWKQNSTMLDMEKVHDQFWIMGIVRAVSVLQMENGDAEIFVYFPYGLKHCNRAGTPVRVDYCTQEGLSKNFKLFSTIKRMKNFYECPLKCVVNNQPPEIMLYEDTNGLQIGGKTVLLLNIFKSHLNFTLNIINVYNDIGGWFFYNESVISKMLTHKNQIDFGFGSFSLLDLNSYPDIDYAFPIFPECFSWAVPLLSGDHPYIWSNFVKEFSPITWTSLIFSYFLAAASIHFISRKLVNANKT